MAYTVDKLVNGNVAIKNNGVNVSNSLPPSSKLQFSNDGLSVIASHSGKNLFGFTLSDIAALQVEGVPITLPTTPQELMDALSTSFFFSVTGNGGETIFLERADATFTPVTGFTQSVETKLAFNLPSISTRGTSYAISADTVTISQQKDTDLHLLIILTSDNNTAVNGQIEIRRVSDDLIITSLPFSILPRKTAAIRSIANISISFGTTFDIGVYEIFLTVDEPNVDLTTGSFQLTATEFTI